VTGVRPRRKPVPGTSSVVGTTGFIAPHRVTDPAFEAAA
jgi:hypothetical protein